VPSVRWDRLVSATQSGDRARCCGFSEQRQCHSRPQTLVRLPTTKCQPNERTATTKSAWISPPATWNTTNPNTQQIKKIKKSPRNMAILPTALTAHLGTGGNHELWNLQCDVRHHRRRDRRAALDVCVGTGNSDRVPSSMAPSRERTAWAATRPWSKRYPAINPTLLSSNACGIHRGIVPSLNNLQKQLGYLWVQLDRRIVRRRVLRGLPRQIHRDVSSAQLKFSSPVLARAGRPHGQR
jgi:hypothetical protein